MRKEDFFEVLGELDDDFVKGAVSPSKKNITWKTAGTMAACLAVVAALGIGILNNSITATPKENTTVGGESTITLKRVINFEGRVTKVEQGHVTLDNGKTVTISEATTVVSPDGSPSEITEGDYIQGYAENVETDDINATYILITTL